MNLDRINVFQKMKRFSDLDAATQVSECMKLIYQRGLTTSSGGNVSVKDEENYIWMTPSVCLYMCYELWRINSTIHTVFIELTNRVLIREMSYLISFPKLIRMVIFMDPLELQVNGKCILKCSLFLWLR